MGLLNDELKEISAEGAAALGIPYVDLISNYSETSYLDIMEPKLRQARKKKIHANPLDYQIVKTTKGSIPAARRVKQVLDSNPGVRKAIETLMVSEQFKAEQLQADHAIRYAYCFLAPKQGISEKEIARDLESTLAEDANRNHLYLALKVLPDVVKSEIHHRKWRHLAERMQEIVIFSQEM